ncbi:hypothetical protein LTR84_008310 [Exophiala bonariae]|uniref:Enoyl reductase (ER) domain-containing protein n=1 Tax=Exophiala bonariae TaxID=1690606 RepID=A0AAV9MY21_9EURO|nr:hypothetical protein LTR84_008310 [Exophiala bonariae]
MALKAIKVVAPGEAGVVSNAIVPRVRDDYLIARTKAVALNPTDYHHAKYYSVPGAILGCDWAGVVQEVGKNVTRFKPGDEVSGVCHGGNNLELEDGAFAEVITAKELAVIHKPKDLSFEDAAALGVGIATTGQILYAVFQLPLPSITEVVREDRGAMLVYGGSSATGTILIQLAKLSGFTVYTTCSVPNFDLVKSRGADHVFDYNVPNFEHEILNTAHGKHHSFQYVVDCFGSDDTAEVCARLISKENSFYHSVKAPLPEAFKKIRTEDSVQATTALGYLLLGEPLSIGGMDFPADPSLEEFSKKWTPVIEELVKQGKVKPHPHGVIAGGLDAIPGILESISQGGTRGKKSVVTVA